jgi:hypothetical protein
MARAELRSMPRWLAATSASSSASSVGIGPSSSRRIVGIWPRVARSRRRSSAPLGRPAATTSRRGESGRRRMWASRSRLSRSAPCRSSMISTSGVCWARRPSSSRRVAKARRRSSPGSAPRQVWGPPPMPSTRRSTGNSSASRSARSGRTRPRVVVDSWPRRRARPSMMPSSALNGMVSRSWQRPSSTSASLDSWRANASISAVLPMPDGPVTTCSTACERRASPSAPARRPSSRWRPTSGMIARGTTDGSAVSASMMAERRGLRAGSSTRRMSAAPARSRVSRRSRRSHR